MSGLEEKVQHLEFRITMLTRLIEKVLLREKYIGSLVEYSEHDIKVTHPPENRCLITGPHPYDDCGIYKDGIAKRQGMQTENHSEGDSDGQPCWEGCSRCTGEYCDVHGKDPCDCDVADRHHREYLQT